MEGHVPCLGAPYAIRIVSSIYSNTSCLAIITEFASSNKLLSQLYIADCSWCNLSHLQCVCSVHFLMSLGTVFI